MKNASSEYIAEEEAFERRPVELYHIWDGMGHWYYTSGDVVVVYDSHTYNPATINRSSTSYDSQLEVTKLQIEAAYVEDPVLEFIATNPTRVLWVSIIKLHRDQEPMEASVIFVGQIKGVSFKGIAARVDCVGFEHFLKQPIPSFRYQLTCNHKLFDSGCKLNAAAYTVPAVVTLDSTKTQLTSAAFSAFADGYFVGGWVSFTNGVPPFEVEKRTVTAHIGSVVTLMYKMKNLDSGDTVFAYPGCDGRAETCRDKFSNTINFLGFPFIPTKNPATRISW